MRALDRALARLDATPAAQSPTPTDETVKRLRAQLLAAYAPPAGDHNSIGGELDDESKAALDRWLEVLDAADLLCRLERIASEWRDRYGSISSVCGLEDALEAARREQARERGGSDGR